MGRWFRVCFGQTTIVLDGVFQTTLYVTVICCVVRNPVWLGDEPPPWRNAAHVFGPFTLTGTEAPPIEAHPKALLRLCFEGELAVMYRIGPRPEFARALHTPEDIGASKPAPIGEGRLNDSIDALFHRCFEFFGGVLFAHIGQLDTWRCLGRREINMVALGRWRVVTRLHITPIPQITDRKPLGS